MKNKLLIIFIAIAFILIVYYFIFAPTIFQEGNPIPIFRGIIRLLQSDDNVAPIDSARYITRTEGSTDSIILFVESKGWTFRGQYGAGYVFQKQKNSMDITISISSVQYSRYFKLWNTIPDSLYR